MASSTVDCSERWRALAKEALEIAGDMTDPAAEERMWQLALRYERLAFMASGLGLRVAPGSYPKIEFMKAGFKLTETCDKERRVRQ